MTKSTVREVSRGSLYLGLEQLTSVFGGVLYSIMVLRMLGPSTYGVLNLGQAAIGLAGALTTNIETYLERFVAELHARGKGGSLRRLVAKVLGLKTVLALIAGILVALLADAIAGLYGYRDLRRLLPVLAPLIFLEAASYGLRQTLFGLQRFRSIWLVALGNNLLKLVLVFALWSMKEGVVALVAAIVVVQIMTVLVQILLVLRFLPPTSGPADEVPTYRRIWAYVLPLYGGRIFFLSGQHLNRLILGALLSAHQLGLVSFALLTIERFIALAGAVPNALLPALSRLKGEGKDEAIEQVVTEGYRVVAAVSVVLTIGIFALAREVTLITGGPEFLPALIPLQVLALVPLFRTMQQPLNMGFYTYERTHVVFWLALLKFVVEPALYPLLIPKFGIAGVAAASLLSSVAVFGPSLRIAGRMFPRTAAVRSRVTWRAWGVAAPVLLLGATMHRLAEPWPGLAARAVLVLLGIALTLRFGGMVAGDDLRRLAETTMRPGIRRGLDASAAWLDRAQGRRAPASRSA